MPSIAVTLYITSQIPTVGQIIDDYLGDDFISKSHINMFPRSVAKAEQEPQSWFLPTLLI